MKADVHIAPRSLARPPTSRPATRLPHTARHSASATIPEEPLPGATPQSWQQQERTRWPGHPKRTLSLLIRFVELSLPRPRAGLCSNVNVWQADSIRACEEDPAHRNFLFERDVQDTISIRGGRPIFDAPCAIVRLDLLEQLRVDRDPLGSLQRSHFYTQPLIFEEHLDVLGPGSCRDSHTYRERALGSRALVTIQPAESIPRDLVAVVACHVWDIRIGPRRALPLYLCGRWRWW